MFLSVWRFRILLRIVELYLSYNLIDVFSHKWNYCDKRNTAIAGCSFTFIDIVGLIIAFSKQIIADCLWRTIQQILF